MMPRVTGKCFLTSLTTRRSSAISSSSSRAVEALLACLGHGDFEKLLGLPVLRLLVQVACLQMLRVVGNLNERRLDRPPLVHTVRAARVETAAARRAQPGWRL